MTSSTGSWSRNTFLSSSTTTISTHISFHIASCQSIIVCPSMMIVSIVQLQFSPYSLSLGSSTLKAGSTNSHLTQFLTISLLATELTFCIRYNVLSNSSISVLCMQDIATVYLSTSSGTASQFLFICVRESALFLSEGFNTQLQTKLFQ